jgi:hypothetical protein
MLYITDSRFVEPLNNVPPESVEADKELNLEDPLVKILSIVRALTFTVGKFPVPPVYVFNPF